MTLIFTQQIQELQRNLKNSISEGQSQKEIISELRENVKKHGLSEPEAVSMIWAAVMSACEWNKKEDLLQEQVELLKPVLPTCNSCINSRL